MILFKPLLFCKRIILAVCNDDINHLAQTVVELMLRHYPEVLMFVIKTEPNPRSSPVVQRAKDPTLSLHECALGIGVMSEKQL